MEIDFTKIPSLVFTKPTSMNYFDEKYAQVNSWRQLFLKIMECLYEDYPEIIRNFSTRNMSSIIVDSEHKYLLRAPGQIAENIWVELNRSSTEFIHIIKRLLDECNIDYENIKINYMHSDENKSSDLFSKSATVLKEHKSDEYSLGDPKEKLTTYIHDKKSGFEDSSKENTRSSFEIWMIREKGLSNSTALSYSYAVTFCEQILENIGMSDNHLFGCNVSEAKRRIEILMNTTPFYKANRDQYNQLKKALKKYVDFIEEISSITRNKNTLNNGINTDDLDVSGKHSQSPSEVEQLLQDELYLPLCKELQKHNITSIQQLADIKLWAFMNQHNLYSIATRQKVLVNVRKLLTSNSVADNGKIFQITIDNTVFEGKSCSEAYMHFCENIANKYPLRIRNLIGKYVEPKHCIALSRSDIYSTSLKMENPTIYIDAKLSTEDVMNYIEWICYMCGETYNEIEIDEPVTNTLTTASHTIEETTSFQHSAISNFEKNSSSNTHNEAIEDNTAIEKIVLQADINGMSYSDLQEQLNCSMSATRNYVSKCNQIVEMKNRLFHKDAFVDWDDGAEQLESIIEKLMQKNNGYVSASQLYEFARVDMNMFLNDNDFNDERSVYEMAQHLYEKEFYHGHHYTFTGKMHISKTGDVIENNFGVICKFAEEQGGMFKYEELKEYLEQIGIKTGNLRMQLKIYTQPDFLYYNEGILISSESMKITQSWKREIKKALCRLFDDVGDHIIIREIMPFWFDQLPDLPGGKPWTPMLLQNVLRFYTDELGAHTIAAMEGQSIETLHTMLVTNDSEIQNFGDAIIAYLKERNIEQKNFEAEDLRAILVDSKMIQGNELIWNMHKALQCDDRFAWDAANKNVMIRV